MGISAEEICWETGNRTSDCDCAFCDYCDECADCEDDTYIGDGDIEDDGDDDIAEYY